MKKILVVDDVLANRKLLIKTLTTINDYEVVEAIDGHEAIEQFERENPDLVLMDISMPAMDGFQAASKIKQLTGNNYLPIIFVTAFSAEHSLSTALASGGDDFISKPIDVGILTSKINAHFRIRELNQQLTENNNRLEQLNQYLSHQHELIEHFFENALLNNFLDEKIIKYHMSSMSAFNGDLLLVGRGPHGGMYLLMGDFTGHGLTAAMGTLPVAMIFFNMTQKGVAVNEIARELNCQLNRLLPSGMFFTATLLEVDARNDFITIWMGGVPESYWLGKNGELKAEIHSQHMPLGILDDAEFDDSTEIFCVENGDKIYLYSDGITEAQGKDGEMFGSERLKKILLTQGDDRFEKVLETLAVFTDASDQTDDISFVEMTCSNVLPVENPKNNAIDESQPLPWRLSISLSAKEVRERDPVTELSNLLGTMPVLMEHKGVLHVLLSEMYSNALDYSILGLDSLKKTNEECFEAYYQERRDRLQRLEDASITVDFSFASDAEQQLKIRISDSGKGYTGHHANTSDERLHGRGLDIIRSICETFSFSDDGRTLEVIYPVSRQII